MEADKWLTLDELSESLTLSRSHLYRMSLKGEIPLSKVKSVWRFDREKIDAWTKIQKSDGGDN